MRSFSEANGRVHIRNGEITVEMELANFMDAEPGYTSVFPACRLYEEGGVHCIISNGNQIEDTLPTSILNEYISKCATYPIDPDMPETPPAAEDNRTPDEIRRAEILSRLEAIDAYSIRPMRAVMEKTDSYHDAIILDNLEIEAQALREELQSMAE